MSEKVNYAWIPQVIKLDEILKNERFEIIRNEEYEFRDENGNVINATKIVLEKKKPKYPESLIECRQILDRFSDEDVNWYRFELLEKLQHLLVCRDAYWKLAGDWKPSWAMYSGLKHCIIYSDNQVKWQCKSFVTEAKVLAFPTSEMRDAFY